MSERSLAGAVRPERGARPLSITVAAWVILVLSTFSALTHYASRDNPMVHELMSYSPIPVRVQYALIVAGLAASVVSALGWLGGHSWARLLYAIGHGTGLAVGFIASPTRLLMLGAMVPFAVIVFVLFRPAANAYFRGSRAGAR